jgi:NlpC/P60 family
MAISGDQLVAEARKFLGDPYVYGAAGPSTFDCSGLIQYVFKQLGISVPRTSEEQAKAGQAVSASELAPGDLVFSPGSDGTAASPGHVGMYAGSGQVIEAPHPGADVRVTALSAFGPTSYRRISGTTPGTAGGVQSAEWWNPFSGDSIFNWPSDVVDFFKSATSDLSSTADFLGSFFRPSTYVRIGSGLFGFIFLMAGCFFLIREARN